MSRSSEFQAKTLDLALIKAAGSFGVSQSEISYKIVEEKKTGGFFGLFTKPEITIAAWLRKADRPQNSRRSGGRSSSSEAPRKQRSAPRSGASHHRDQRNYEPKSLDNKRPQADQQEPAIPLTAEQTEALVQELVLFCKDICEKVITSSVSLSHELQTDRLVINIQNAEIASVIEKNSKFAESLEHLLRKKPRHLKQELPFRIFIDADGARIKKEATLIQLASDLSEKVFESKRPIVLNYRSPYDRKIIHMTLDKDDRVYTKSIGSGSNRKLMILPNRDQDAEGHIEYDQNEIEQINEQP